MKNNVPMPMFPPNPQKLLEDLNKSMNDLQVQVDKINKANMKALRNIFKEEIKETFLIKIYNTIKKEHPDIIDYYANAFNLNVEGILQGAGDRIDYDLCCHIVGIHKSNILFLSEEERGRLQKSSEYCKKLCNQVYEHVRLRGFGSSFFRNKTLVTGDRFLYFTMGYDMFVVSTYILFVLCDGKYNDNKYYGFYSAIISEAISILTLVENGLLMQAFPQCRNLIELYFKYETLFKFPEAIDEYDTFCQYEINYGSLGKFDEEFQKKYKKIKDFESINIIDYLHYGWIDSVFEFNYLGKDKKYSIVGLYNYLIWKNKNNADFPVLKDAHNKCHMFSHGSTISKAYPIQSYFELIQVLYIVLRAILIDICNMKKSDAIINEINIRTKIENDMKELSAKAKLLTVENVKKYYSGK